MLRTIFESRKGTSLETLLNDPEFVESIKSKRILYILKPAMETNIVKFGIAGHGAGKTLDNKTYNENSSMSRLKSYITQYGRKSDCKTRQSKDDCKYGVQLYLILGNNYDNNVLKTNSAVFKKEAYMKHKLRNSIRAVDRGEERTNAPLGDIFKYALDNKFSEDHVADMAIKERLRANIKNPGFYQESKR